MRKLLLGTLVAVCALALAAAASAGKPTKTSINDSGTADAPAGTLCNFHYFVAFADTGTQTVFSDRTELHLVLLNTHTNVDTGYTLTERDQINVTVYLDGSSKEVGVFWHLRDASGKLVVVQAGQIRFDPLGNVVKFTPNSGPDFAAVICPALGGSPA